MVSGVGLTKSTLSLPVGIVRDDAVRVLWGTGWISSRRETCEGEEEKGQGGKGLYLFGGSSKIASVDVCEVGGVVGECLCRKLDGGGWFGKVCGGGRKKRQKCRQLAANCV
jgi:hypothetical protein